MNKKKIISEEFPANLGVNFLQSGVSFSLFSETAEKVELCFFDSQHQETQRIELPFVTNNIWHAVIANVHAGDFYGYRVYGPWDPNSGFRFNHHKLLLDPYAKKISHLTNLVPEFYSYKKGHGLDDLSFDEQDNSKIFPKAIVTNNLPQYNVKRPNIPWSKSLIYELHVKGFSQIYPEVPLSSRGKFNALKHPSVIDRLKRMGFTAIKIMPPQLFLTEQYLLDKNLTNFWGYNPFNFFIPHMPYGEIDSRKDFIAMVDKLHEHEIEVIVDLVFNHTAECDHLGPNLSFRGIDNSSYYILDKNNPRFYDNYSGCGNTINAKHPAVARLIVDSLVDWANLGVDGIRFDLASILAIDSEHKFDPYNPIFTMITQNPKLNALKLIAEPWHINDYNLGQYPKGWSELNDRFKNQARSTVAGYSTSTSNIAHVIAGTADSFSIYDRHNHRPINYITNHDGMTLWDLVSYNTKQNLANLEDNKDGNNNENSINYGIDGATDDLEIVAKRVKHIKNLLFILFFSQGVPLIQAGDELLHSKQGNNNTFCQDNALSWINWQESPLKTKINNLVKDLSLWRKQKAAFFELKKLNQEFREIYWFDDQSNVINDDDWSSFEDIKLGVMYFLSQKKAAIFCFINLTGNHVDFKLPNFPIEFKWQLKFDSNQEDNTTEPQKQTPNSITLWEANLA